MSEELKHKLHNYEVVPPSGVWEIIYQELQECNKLSILSEKLYSHEVNPPEISWQIISQNLQDFKHASSQAPVRNIHKRVYSIIAAATVLGIIILGSVYIINNNSYKSRISSKQTKYPDNSEDKATKPLTVLTPPRKPETKVTQHLNATISGTLLDKSRSKHSRENDKTLHNTLITNVRSLGTELGIFIQPKPIRNERGYIIQNLNLMNMSGNDYISVTGPNGQQTKISSKFMNVLLYMNGDNNIEQFEGYFSKTFMESLIWKSRFQEWRNKILQTSFIPSSYNFMDILEFKDLIIKDKENQ